MTEPEEVYKRGDRVVLSRTTDPHTRLEPGAMGTVESVDDTGTVHVFWDDGQQLGLVPGVDVWRPIHPRWETWDWHITYPPRGEIRLLELRSADRALSPGTTGRVLREDEDGTVWVQWKNGATFGLVPGIDRWEAAP